MPAEGAVQAIHATAVAIGDRALLIRGPSRAGKSRLALALIARSTPTRPIRLIGDDRIQLHRTADGLMARPHPRIAGFIERRGLGLVAMSWVAEARIGGIVDLRHPEAAKLNPEPVCVVLSEQDAGFGFALGAPKNDEQLIEFPRFIVDDEADETARADHVLAWWAALSATWAPHLPAKARGGDLAGAKD